MPLRPKRKHAMKCISNLRLSIVIAMTVLVCAGAAVVAMACSYPGSSAAYADEATLDDEAASDDSNEPSSETKRDTADAGTEDDKSDQRIISCWGDSLTKGVGASFAFIIKDGTLFNASFKSYPEILERLTGIKTINYGFSGATSEEIAFYQRLFLPLHELRTANAAEGRGAKREGDVIILEIGSNGGWENDYDMLIEQYRDMIDRSECNNYIVIGDTDDPGTSIADVLQEPLIAGWDSDETDWEAALNEAFGDHFINMRVFLIDRGLETAGLEATEEDDEAAKRGCVSEQLRSDWTHLNSYGYYAQAMAVYEKGLELGYW